MIIIIIKIQTVNYNRENIRPKQGRQPNKENPELENKEKILNKEQQDGE